MDIIEVLIINKAFTKKQLEADDPSTPCITLEDGTSFIFKQVNNIIVLVVSKNNVNVSMAFTFIYA